MKFAPGLMVVQIGDPLPADPWERCCAQLAHLQGKPMTRENYVVAKNSVYEAILTHQSQTGNVEPWSVWIGTHVISVVIGRTEQEAELILDLIAQNFSDGFGYDDAQVGPRARRWL